ncbi:MAG: hypothetical protein MI867_07445, partial [Pseudomonadales bacterium]|nr:hypothetical protein [Pseudomonadales bacterium]
IKTTISTKIKRTGNFALIVVAPILVLILIGLLLHLNEFHYIKEYVIACGAIVAAFVAYYIAISTDVKKQQIREESRKTMVNHVSNLINEGIGIINKELGNYDKFIQDLSVNGMEQIELSTTPFYFLEEVNIKFVRLLFNAENQMSIY